MARPLPQSFFARRTLAVARDMVGCVLARRVGGKTLRLTVTETEAYVGPRDLASHAARGRTPRNEPMFGEPGRLYVYFIYGVHWMLNVVTEANGYPAAVLIRGVEGAEGPGRLTKLLNITGANNRLRAAPSSGLWFEAPAKERPRRVERLPRVGVGYAGPLWAQKPYRFRAARAAGARIRHRLAKRKAPPG